MLINATSSKQVFGNQKVLLSVISPVSPSFRAAFNNKLFIGPMACWIGFNSIQLF